MDFATRDRYRHAIEETAKRGNLGKRKVAEAALRLASEAADGEVAPTPAPHVGYYLIDADCRSWSVPCSCPRHCARSRATGTCAYRCIWERSP
jgi:hypothetical protein